MSKMYGSECSRSRSEWDLIPAVEEDSMRVRDRQRAAVCSVAVNQEAEVAKSIFAKYNDLTFETVTLAPGLTRQRPRILVATAYDFCNNHNVLTTYVAFKGSSPLEAVFDIADSQLQCQGPDGTSFYMKGHIHNGLYKALMEELPGPMELMGVCGNLEPDSQMDRLIFCGHGLGGALSHLSMLSLLFSLFGNNSEELKKSENTFLSIAFGAPLFLDAEARDYFSSTGMVPVESRFLTYVNDEDPVPLMLHKLIACTTHCQPLLQSLHKKLNTKFQTLVEVAGKVPYLLEKKDMLKGCSSRRTSTLKLNIPPSMRQLGEADVDMDKLKNIQYPRGRGYAAFGQFIRFSGPGMQNSVVQSELDSWRVSWAPDTVKYHAMGHYAYNVLLMEPSQVPLPKFGEGIPPKVEEAFLTIISGHQQGDITGARLEVVGYNLGLCLRKKCVVSDFADKWEITRVEHNSIVFRNKVKVKDTEVSVLAKQMTKVKVETMFGVTDWIEVRRKPSGADSHVIDGLKHVIGKLVIFDSVQDMRPGSPSHESKDKLRGHLKKVAGLIGKHAESALNDFYSSLHDPKKSVFYKRLEADAFIEHVSNHLHHNTLKVKLEPFIGTGDRRRFIVRKGLGGVGFGMFSVGVGITMYVALAVIVSVSTMGIAVPIAAGGLAIGVAALILSYRKVIKLEDYDQILKFMYGPLNPGNALLPRDKNVADYEKAIIEKVQEISFSNPNAWIQQLQHHLRDQVRDTTDAVLNFIQLMLEIDKAVKVAKEQKVLAIVGPENVGKSTLINILRNGAPKDDEDAEDEDEKPGAATTGYTKHTDDPKGYTAMAVGNLVVVDFPGMGAAQERKPLSTMWEAFERLPDLCMVLMRFNGDVTEECAAVPKRVRKKLCDNVVLVVNHVDGIMKGRKNGKVWKEYPPSKVQEMTQDFNRNCDGILDSVMLTSLSCNLYTEEKEMLKERGILLAEGVLHEIRRLVYRNQR